jgi:signal peptidase
MRDEEGNAMRSLSRATATVRRVLDAVLIALIFVVLFGVILAKVVPLTGRQTIIVGGASMEPAIGIGSAIIIAPVAPADLKVGDVVTLRAGEDLTMFTHRIVEIVDQPDGRWVQTKGDANATVDPTLVYSSAIEGRVQLAIPLAGYLIALLSIPTGVLFLIGLAATLLAAVWLLESLELDSHDRGRHEDAPTLGQTLGEPMAARPVASRSLATEGGFGGGRLTVAEQIALARATRERRAKWQPSASERADGRSD